VFVLERAAEDGVHREVLVFDAAAVAELAGAFVVVLVDVRDEVLHVPGEAAAFLHGGGDVLINSDKR
jgi:hypothetical protein